MGKDAYHLISKTGSNLLDSGGASESRFDRDGNFEVIHTNHKLPIAGHHKIAIRLLGGLITIMIEDPLYFDKVIELGGCIPFLQHFVRTSTFYG